MRTPARFAALIGSAAVLLLPAVAPGALWDQLDRPLDPAFLRVDGRVATQPYQVQPPAAGVLGGNTSVRGDDQLNPTPRRSDPTRPIYTGMQ